MDNALDTLSTARRLEHEYGMDPRAAEGVAVVIHEYMTAELATKPDLHVQGSELRADMQSLRAAMQVELQSFRAEMATGFKMLYRHLWIMMGVYGVLIVTLMKLLP